MHKSGVEMFKIGPDPVSYFSEKTRIIWENKDGNLTAKVESTDLNEGRYVEMLLKQADAMFASS